MVFELVLVVASCAEIDVCESEKLGAPLPFAPLLPPPPPPPPHAASASAHSKVLVLTKRSATLLVIGFSLISSEARSSIVNRSCVDRPPKCLLPGRGIGNTS